VIACDQYTSDAAYWDSVRELAGDGMSTLNLIFPELYLERESEEQGRERIKSAAKNMRDYTESGSFVSFRDAMFLVERTLKNGAKRRGILGAVDLEEYSYAKGSKAKIVPTEETVVSRIPPRVKIREQASLELPHAMLLYNDDGDVLMENLRKQPLEKIYDFTLMQDSGKICAYLLDAQSISFVKNTLGEFGKDFLFAVGDGNHSLAAAKACYENIKQTDPDYLNHPA
jgi:uncharacterized protein (DUF1015 family)